MREINEITGEVVDAAFYIHSRLGPGLLESAYESVLEQALQRKGLCVERQKAISFTFDGLLINDGFKVDLLIDGSVVVELKSVERLAPVHSKQLLTYLRILELPIGLLINFGAPRMSEGLQRIVNSRAPSARLLLGPLTSSPT
jgi:GxxExxY protein